MPNGVIRNSNGENFVMDKTGKLLKIGKDDHLKPSLCVPLTSKNHSKVPYQYSRIWELLISKGACFVKKCFFMRRAVSFSNRSFENCDLQLGLWQPHLVLFLGAPLAVVEDDGDGRNVFADAGQDLVEGHPPRAVADVGDAQTLGSRHFRTLHFLC